MSNRKSKLVFGLVVLATITSVVLAGCGPTPVPTPTAGPTPTPKVITQVVTPTPAPITGKLFLNLGPGDVPTIDPALSTDTSSVQIVEETTVGLTRQHEETTATEPGIATEWKQSADGLKWTFKLRNDVTWVKYNTATGKVEQVLDKDKKPRVVTAKDFEYGVKRTLNPKTASDYAYVLNFFIKGGEAFNTADTNKLSEAELKKLEDAVGVKAIDDFTIEFT
ncbi:MAG: hypothetical protein HY871_03795, partial [Chloroflexi bacterium]|nr:hypothetical protein [Chloroflexota bacterium]